MDALRRVTGKDLFQKFQPMMNPDLALAAIAARQQVGQRPEHQQSVVFSPGYSQLDYFSPLLLGLAREYRIPTCQYLAKWDDTLGRLQTTRYRTFHGEQLLFELGGYAYLWCDETAPTKPLERRLSFHFPSVDEAYLRQGWEPGGLLAAVDKGEVVVHAGGQPVLIEPSAWREPVAGVHIQSVQDNGRVAAIHCTNSVGEALSVQLDRPQRRLTIRRRSMDDWQWWCQGDPARNGSVLKWKSGVTLGITSGEIKSFEPRGYEPVLAVGFGKLRMDDPSPAPYPKCVVRKGTNDQIVLQVGIKKF
jgi:hypothetical protein